MNNCQLLVSQPSQKLRLLQKPFNDQMERSENEPHLDHEPFKSNRRRICNGLGLGIIQAGKVPGKITLNASSEGMRDDKIEIIVLK